MKRTWLRSYPQAGRVVSADELGVPVGEAEGVIDVDIVAKGDVSREERAHAAERLASLDACVPVPVLGARVMLRHERNPRLELPSRAEAELNVKGRVVCGRVAAGTIPQAIDELARNLERQLEEFGERRLQLLRTAPSRSAGEWRHGTWSAPRPPYFPRPAEERELIRRKTFALEPLEPLQAVAEMLDLDHAFYLFEDAQTGTDAVVYRRDDGRIGLIEPAGTHVSQPADGPVRETSRFRVPIALEVAISEMNALSHRFMFFTDADTGRGNIIYMRYDGHYGLIEPA